MINFIKVLNRMSLSHMVWYKYIPYDSWYLISIYGDDQSIFLTEKILDKIRDMGCRAHLSLCFLDYSEHEIENLSETDKKMLFNIDHAKKIIEFVDSIKDDDDSVIVIHCDAGISRSGAVGMFLCEYLQCNYKDFSRVNPQIRPNSYVLRLLKKESQIEINSSSSVFNYE